MQRLVFTSTCIICNVEMLEINIPKVVEFKISLKLDQLLTNKANSSKNCKQDRSVMISHTLRLQFLWESTGVE